MQLQEKAHRILQQPVCDRCLGRQFAQLLSGYTNEERGQLMRTVVAMSIDKEGYSGAIDLSNFRGFKFYKLDANPEKKKCAICNDIFETLHKTADKVVRTGKKFEYNTFLVGTKISFDLISREEALWERVGIDYCEPIKAELNREIGKLVEKKIKPSFHSKPDINFVVHVPENKVDTQVNPIFIYGEYQKLVRGIPQTKWPSKKYKTSVEEIMAKPFMLATRGRAHKLHGLGREDIDAKCLGWRPFVLEILEPKKRKIDIKKLSKRIGRGIKVRKMRPSNISEVRKIKEERADKTYKAVVVCEGIKKSDLRKLKPLLKGLKQKTPERVMHRRADKYRFRKVHSIRTKFISKKKFHITAKCEAGLYVKEMISGDNGRTTPSVSSILDQTCMCKELDVLKIHSSQKK